MNEFRGINFVKIRNKQFFAPSSKLVLENIKKKLNAKIMLNTKVLDVNINNDIFTIFTNRGEFRARKLVIASGGISYPNLGVSDIALQIANKFNLEYKPFLPALVPFTLQKDEFFMKNLSGVSIDCRLKIATKVLNGALLFTHKSISGPIILSASLFWEKGKISIDFLNDFNINFNQNKQLSSILPLPKSFIKEYLKANNLEDKIIKNYDENERNIIKKLRQYEFSPAGNLGFSKAEVCKGGISLNEIDKNYESKKYKNLFFIGECVNVTGELGGFNIHFAFASANKVARFLNLS